MAKDAFEIDWKQLLVWQKFFKKAPRLFKIAQRGVLNAQAFHMKKILIPASIHSKMIVRSPKFVNSSIRVSMAKGNKMQSEVGSVFRKGFSGWNEQQLGTKSKRDYVNSPYSRSDNRRNKVVNKRRLKTSNKRVKISDYNVKGNSIKQRNIVWLQMMGKNNERRPFKLEHAVGKLSKGIYMFNGNKIRRIANTEPKSTQPKKIPWLTNALMKQKPSDVNLMWKSQLNRVKKFK